MGIKRGNADWQTISVTRMYQLEALTQLLDSLDNAKPSGRELEGTMKIYSNKNQLMDEINNCRPLSGVLDIEGGVYLGCRTTKDDAGDTYRSAICLYKLMFDDGNGELLKGMCWCAPISLSNDESSRLFNSRQDVSSSVSEYLLILPQINDDGDAYQNSYHVIGHKWSERISNGTFTSPNLTPGLYQDWKQE